MRLRSSMLNIAYIYAFGRRFFSLTLLLATLAVSTPVELFGVSENTLLVIETEESSGEKSENGEEEVEPIEGEHFTTIPEKSTQIPPVTKARNALKRGGFHLYLSPIIDTPSNPPESHSLYSDS